MDNFTLMLLVIACSIAFFFVGRAVGLNEGIEHLAEVLDQMIEVKCHEAEGDDDGE